MEQYRPKHRWLAVSKSRHGVVTPNIGKGQPEGIVEDEAVQQSGYQRDMSVTKDE